MAGKGSKQPVFTSPAWVQTLAGPSPRPSSSARAGTVRPHPDRVLGAQPQEAQRHEDRGVGVLADEHPHLRRSVQALGLDVPAGPLENGVTTGGDPGEVRHRAACGEPEAGILRQAERLEHPAPGDLLRHRGGGAADVQARDLIPGAGQPVRPERGRQRPTDHEAEVARTAQRDQSRLRRVRQLLHDLCRILALVGELPVQGLAQVRDARPFGHRTTVDPGEVAAGPLVGDLEHALVSIEAHRGHPAERLAR